MVVAPLDRGEQCLLSPDGGVPAPCQQSEPVVETRANLLDREHLHARRRQFDREWNSVESPADLADGFCIVVPQQELRDHVRSPIDEQPHGFAFPQLGRCPLRSRGGKQQRANGDRSLAAHAQAFAASSQDAELRRGGEKTLDQRRARCHEVLAIVDDE